VGDPERRGIIHVGVVGIVGIVLALALGIVGPAVSTASTARSAGPMPMAFEPNLGQADPAVRFLARGRGYGLFLTSTEAVLVLAPGRPLARGGPAVARAGAPALVRMRMVGADPSARIAGAEPRPGHNH
jgi:hypothetical protein